LEPVSLLYCRTSYIAYVTLRHVRVTIVAALQHCMLWVCVCSLRYTACNAHASYCHLWAYTTLQYFSTLSHKWHDIRKI